MSDHRRVYGTDRGEDSRPLPGRTYTELCEGPLDGQLLDVTGWTDDALTKAAALITEAAAHGPGGRALYDPAPVAPGRWGADRRHPLIPAQSCAAATCS
ncbi:hypothetical protein ABZ621_35630 [Streptomyces sp. NPDC007863]|uniref:hypothetical protein n=1 Tax=Streptomyces sp. NPDC007863 TaxID=3154894 RepID=UPI0033DEAF8C